MLQSTGTATRWLRVQDSEFGVSTELHQSEVRWSVLDVGFSLCTAPTFCQCDVSRYFRHRFGVHGQGSELGKGKREQE